MFSERLKQLRKSRGITQVQFANEFNVANGTIAMWETGKREPDFAMTIRIATFFQVSIDYLLGNEHNLIQDECSKLFRHNLLIALEQLDVAWDDDSEAEYDYRALQELVESTYPLTVKEVAEAADIIGVPLHDLFREDYEVFLQKKSPTPVIEDGLDNLDKLLIQNLRDLTPDVKRMILAQMQVMKESQKERQPSSAQE